MNLQGLSRRPNKNERLCCPFFEFDLHVGDNSTQIVLQITGPEGIKQFMKAELSEMIGYGFQGAFSMAQSSANSIGKSRFSKSDRIRLILSFRLGRHVLRNVEVQTDFSRRLLKMRIRAFMLTGTCLLLCLPAFGQTNPTDSARHSSGTSEDKEDTVANPGSGSGNQLELQRRRSSLRAQSRGRVYTHQKLARIRGRRLPLLYPELYRVGHRPALQEAVDDLSQG